MALTVNHQQVADLPPANAEAVSASLLAQPLPASPGKRSSVVAADRGPAALPAGSASHTHPALAAIYGGVLGLLVSLYLIWLFAEA